MNKVSAKEIEVGKKYTVSVPDGECFFNIKQLVLARNTRTIITVNLDTVKVPTKDRKKLLSLKVKDFIENDKDVTMKYEEDIVIYEVRKGLLIDPMEDCCTFFSKN